MSASTAILVDKAIARLISENGILLDGMAQYITLQFPDNGSLIIINIYAAKSSNEKAPMWKKLSEVGFTANHIILGGDFNHFEETNRRGIARERQMCKRKVATWHHMTL
jgi:hypothetical protein